MSSVLQDYIDDFMIVYVDDILIYSETREDHERHVSLVLERLKKEKLRQGEEMHVQQ
jgi:hypothetical protein